MESKKYESKPNPIPLAESSLKKMLLINETYKKLGRVSDYDLETADGRLGLLATFQAIFERLDEVEGEGEYEVVGSIRDDIRSFYEQLYNIKFDGPNDSEEAREFYSGINEIMEYIDEHGKRFVADMDIYKKYNEEPKQAQA